MTPTRFDPCEKIAIIWREQIADWKTMPFHDYVATYEDIRYEADVQSDPAVKDAIAEMAKYREGEDVAATLPLVVQKELADLARQGEMQFGAQPTPAKITWQLPLFLAYLAALALPIFIGKHIDDAVYFISKISTAVVTIYMLIPYIHGHYLSLGMLWKFAETRLIHPLAPLMFVILALIPTIGVSSRQIWYKALSGFLALMILIAIIFVTSLKRKLLLARVAKDFALHRNGNDVAAFDNMRLASRACFQNALERMLRLEKGDTKIKIGHAKRDQTSFRKETLAIFIDALELMAPANRTTSTVVNWRKRFITTLRKARSETSKIIFISDDHWKTYHHPLPKCPVLFMEIGFIIGQLIIYRGYLATFIDTLATQTRVVLKLCKIIFNEKEPAEAALAEFSKLVAGAFIGFFIMGIPYAIMGAAWVEGINQVYLSLGLTIAKMTLSNHVAPFINMFGLSLVVIAQTVWKLVRKCF